MFAFMKELSDQVFPGFQKDYEYLTNNEKESTIKFK